MAIGSPARVNRTIKVGDGRSYRFIQQPGEKLDYTFDFSGIAASSVTQIQSSPTVTYGIGSQLAAPLISGLTVVVYVDGSALTSGTSGKITIKANALNSIGALVNTLEGEFT